MSIDTTSGAGGSSSPERKAHANLADIEHSVLEGLRSQKTSWVDPEGNRPSMLQLEHELADPTTAEAAARKL
jgi:hypothetical protein